jgi:AcrR family transcriptional regulator
VPRPRKVTDAEVYSAAMRAMSRLGPSELTLAEIAGEAGVTAGALVQRFGSKHALMLRMAEGAAAGTGMMFAGLRRRHRSPLATIRAYAECMADMAPSPAALARNLAYLQADLADPDLRIHVVAQARATRRELEALVGEAIACGELAPRTDARALARTVEAVVGGALLTWAFHVEGAARSWLRRHVDAVLAPHLAAARRVGPKTGRAGER